MAWSPRLISLFHRCKSNLIPSTLLLRCDNFKLVSLTTDWSAAGMGYILMQLDNSRESIKALRHLATTGECLFELSLDGPISCHVAFGSRFNLPYEVYYHPFLGEIACDHWSIAYNRRYLWGRHFY